MCENGGLAYGRGVLGFWDMETTMNILSQPFTWGFVLGLFLMLMTWRLMRKDVSMLRSDNKRLLAENKELQSHLGTQLKINAKGNEQLEKQVEELKSQNETLRSNLNLANQKPGRAERRQLEILEEAASAMREQAPGFAPAWEKAIRNAEDGQIAAEGGFKKLMRRVLPSRKTQAVTTVIDSDIEDVTVSGHDEDDS